MNTRSLLSLSLLFAFLLVMSSSTAWAYLNEPNGWDGYGWFVQAEKFVRAHKELRGQVKPGQIRKAIQTQDVVLRTNTVCADHDMKASWVFNNDGLFRVTLRWENTRPEAYNAYKKVLEDLRTEWGEPDSDISGELVWKGKCTKIVAKRARASSGSAVDIVMNKQGGNDACNDMAVTSRKRKSSTASATSSRKTTASPSAPAKKTKPKKKSNKAGGIDLNDDAIFGDP